MVAKPKKQTQHPHELTDAEWDELVDRAARHFMHMSGEEFKLRWEAGEFPDPDGTPAMYVASLLSEVGRNVSEARGVAEPARTRPSKETAMRTAAKPRSKSSPPRVREATDAQWEDLVDGAARYHLGISGEEFKRRWEAGEFPDPDNTPGVMAVAMLLPYDSFAR